MEAPDAGLQPAGQGWRRALPVALILVAVIVAGSLMSPASPRESGAILDVETGAPAPPPPPRRERPAPEPSEVGETAAGAPVAGRPVEATGAWQELSAPTLASRYGHTTIWTGEELVVWGGAYEGASRFRSSYFDDGAAYRVEGDQWRMLSESPLSARQDAIAAWTGSEVLVWGGNDGSSMLADGAAYDPAADRWRPIAPSPLLPRQSAASVWTGAELLIFGGHDLAGPHADGAAYDPVRDAWRLLAAQPDPEWYGWMPRMAWAGDFAVVWSDAAPPLAYRPADDAWRQLPRAGDDDGAVDWIIPIDERLYAVVHAYTGVATRILSLGPDDDEWTALAEQRTGGWSSAAVRTDRGIVAMAEGSRHWLYDVQQDEWLALPQGPPFDPWLQQAIWTGDELLVLAAGPEGLSGSRRSWVFRFFDEPGDEAR